MKKTLSGLYILLILPMVFSTFLNAGEVREVLPEKPLTGDEVFSCVPGGGVEKTTPSSPRYLQVGTVIDSTVYDYQCNATIHQRIATVGDSALHVTGLVSPDSLTTFPTRGMKYFYYQDGVFTNFGFVEGNGVGDQRGGFGSVVSYHAPGLGIGNIAVVTSHCNLSGLLMGAHWYSFDDAFQGIGAFAAHEGPPFGGIDPCDTFLWPGLYITNDQTGNMAMVGKTNADPCSGGFDDIMVTHKTFADAEWGDPVLLHTLDDPDAWNNSGGADIPMIAGADNNLMCIVSSDFGTNMYLWASFDGGATWSNRINITGYPTDPHNVPPDSTSTEYRPQQNNAIAMSPGGIPHVVWTEYQARGNSPDSTYNPGVSSLFQYRTRLAHWDPVNGVTTVYRHPPGLSDVAVGTVFSYNVGHPTIGFGDTDDIIYVVHEGFVDADFDPTSQRYFGDIYVSMSTDGGVTWKDRVNITDSPGSDDLFPSIARKNPQGLVQDLPGFSVGEADGINDFVMVYQNDDVAGTFLRLEEPSWNWDMLLVAPVDFDGMGPDLEINIEPVNGIVFAPGDWIIYEVTLTNNSTSVIPVTASTYASNTSDWQVNLWGPFSFNIPGETTLGPVQLQSQVPMGAPSMSAYICAEANDVHDCYQVTIE